MRRTMRALVTALTLASGLLLCSGVAHATSYTCNEGGNPPPSSVTGDAILTETGSCTLTTSLTASGQINITAGAAVSTKSLTAGSFLTARPTGSMNVVGNISAQSYVDIRTPTGSATNKINVTGTITTQGATVYLIAGGNVATGAIDTSGGSGGGAVDIYSNLAVNSITSSSPFVTGSAGNANGVNGTIKADTVSGGNNGNHFVHIFNGGTGGVRLTNATDISAKATAAKAGAIVLDAFFGNVTLPAGTISLDGASGQAAGRIILMGNKVVATSGATTLTASDSGSGLQHFVWVAATEIDYGAAGLTINANGTGPVTPSPLVSGVSFVSRGGISVSDNGNPVNPVLTTVLSASNNPLTVTGAGPLAVNANGDNLQVKVTAFPVIFTGGTVDIHSNGNDKNLVLFSYPGTASGANSLEFLGGVVNVTANGTNSSSGGKIQVLADNMGTSTPASGASFSANGAGSGSGGTIDFELTNSSVAFGATGSWFKLSANGGSSGSSSGNGGTITVHGDPNTSILIEDSGVTPAPSMVAGPLGLSGAGGTIDLVAGTFTVEGPPGITGPGTLKVDGVGTGRGGRIHIETTAINSNPIILGNTGSPTIPLTEQIQLSAKALGTGDGGTIEVISANSLTVDGAVVTVDAGTNGNGGTISLKGRTVTANPVSGTLKADGNGSGDGGIISVEATNGPLALGSGNFVFSAKSLSSGDGGHAFAKGTVVVADSNSVNVSAGPTGNGKGGDIGFTSTVGTLTVSGALNVNGAGSGSGGNIALESAGQLIATGDATANGGATGNGGSVSIKSAGLVFTSTLRANGGTTSGAGGFVSVVSTAGSGSLNIGSAGGFAISAIAPSSGDGGDVTIDAGSQSVNVSGGSISVAAAGNGNGGSVDVKTNGQLNVSGTVSADAKGSGLAGTVTLTQTAGSSSSMVLDGATISASADPAGSGSGNTVIITSAGNTPVSLVGTTIKADASPIGTGTGGTININVASTTAADLSQGSFSAKGGDTGAGGIFAASHARGATGQTLGVLSVINVDAGPTASSTTFGGSIRVIGHSHTKSTAKLLGIVFCCLGSEQKSAFIHEGFTPR